MGILATSKVQVALFHGKILDADTAEPFQIGPIVLLAKEVLLPLVVSDNDVLETPRNEQPWTTRHRQHRHQGSERWSTRKSLTRQPVWSETRGFAFESRGAILSV